MKPNPHLGASERSRRTPAPGAQAARRTRRLAAPAVAWLVLLATGAPALAVAGQEQARIPAAGRFTDAGSAPEAVRHVGLQGGRITAAPGRTPVLQPAAASPADSLAAMVDSLFAPWDRTTSPGAAVAVIRDGRLTYSRGYGIANLEYGIPIRPSTVFHIASISKHFTAFALGLLDEEGRLSLDDDVRTHLPELPDFGRTITLRHLIHHTSGIRDQWELLAMSGWRLDDVITMDHIRKTLELQRDLNFEPGAEHLYSNSGYTLMAMVVERVSGQSFREFTGERIFEPLGMTSTHFHDDHEMIVPDRAYSYAPLPGGGFRNAPLNYANAGATSLFTTVEDMAKWERNWIEPRVGSAALLDRMLERGVLNNGDTIPYAHALGVGAYRGLRTVSHGGADAGYRTAYLRFPDQGYAFVVFSNLASFNPGRLAQQVADIYLGGEMASAVAAEPAGAGDGDAPGPPRTAPPVRLTERQLATLAGVYVDPETDAVTRFESRDGTLRVVQAAGPGPGVALRPVDDRRFVIEEGPPVEFLFEGPADGRPERLVVIAPGGVRNPYEPAVAPTAARLAEYEGVYYSAELETTYAFHVRGGRLVAFHRRHEDITLTPTLADRFNGNRWWFRTVRFQRDDAGRIAGFTLTGGRVRNLRFDRLEGWPSGSR